MQSDIIIVEVKYGAKQIIFMRKSLVETRYSMGNQIISRYGGWSDIVGWAQNLLVDEQNYLPK